MTADRFLIRQDARFLNKRLETVFPLKAKERPEGAKNPLLVEAMLPMSPAVTEPSSPLEDRGCVFLRDGRIGLQVITDPHARKRFGMRGLEPHEASALLLYLCDQENLINCAWNAQAENVKLLAALKAYRREGGPTPKEIKEADALLAAIEKDQADVELQPH